jgi:hypothetical protein
MIEYIIANLLLLLFPCIEGFIHAILYSKKGADAFPGNEHISFNIMRANVFAIFIAGRLCESWEDILLILLCFPLAYSFLHNGFYYITRRRIDVPSYHWFSNSTHNSARINYGPLERTIMFIVAMVFHLLYLGFNYGIFK